MSSRTSAGEEEKSEQEPLKLWGHIENGVIVNAESPVITSQCLRSAGFRRAYRGGLRHL